MNFEKQCAAVGRAADKEITRLWKRIRTLEGLVDAGHLDWDVEAAHDELLSEMVGYAKHAEVTGGKGGEVLVAGNYADLRNHLRVSGPRIILFDKSMDGAEIKAQRNEVRPDKTLWARTLNGKPLDITIESEGDGTGLFFDHAHNVVMSGIRGTSSRDRWCRLPANAQNIWLHDCEIEGGVDILAKNVTVQNCMISNAIIAHACDADATVTLHESLYDDCLKVLELEGLSVVHAHKCHINWTLLDGPMQTLFGVAVSISRGTYYSTFCDYIGTGEAIRIKLKGTWTGHNNHFGGAKVPPTSGRVDVPYEY